MPFELVVQSQCTQEFLLNTIYMKSTFALIPKDVSCEACVALRRGDTLLVALQESFLPISLPLMYPVPSPPLARVRSVLCSPPATLSSHLVRTAR